MADWDTTNPEDSGIVSQYPANARAAREAVVTNFGIDHHEANDADVGKHEVIQLTAEATPTIAAGQIGLWNDGGVLKTRTGTGAAAAVLFPAGTRMIFAQAAAPVGWTIVTGLNDRVLRVDSASGGATGGSWTISGISVNNHALTISQLPSHNHGGSTGNAGSHNHTGTTATDGSHSHSGTANSSGAHSHTATGNDSFDGSQPNRIFVNETENFHTASTDVAGAHTHSLNINSAGNHNHTFTTSTQASHDHSISAQGSGSGHNHGLSIGSSWRPSYVDIIICEKD